MPNICVFSSYDNDSIVYPYVFHLVEELKDQLNCEKFLFISTSKEVSKDDEARLKELGVEVYLRENIGYDFGSYFYGCKLIDKDIEHYDRIFFVNDSIYGPFENISGFIEKYNDFDLWGLTDSYQHQYHLQSYFLCVNKSGYEVLQQFISRYMYPSEYESVVQNGEIGFTQNFLNNNCNICCVFPLELLISKNINEDYFTGYIENLNKYAVCAPEYNQYVYEKLLHVNPSFDYWSTLLKLGYPFVKRKNLVTQHYFLKNIGLWFEGVGQDHERAVRLMYSHVTLMRNKIWRYVNKSKKTKFKIRMTTRRKVRRRISELGKLVRRRF